MGEHTRTGLSVESLKRAMMDNRFCLLGRPFEAATLNDHYMALAYTIRDRMLERFIRTAQRYKQTSARTVCYLSAEFLTGPHLGHNIVKLEIWDNVEQAVKELDLDLQELLEQEEEPGLGNGGLGRLAACYMDSMATLGIPSIGYGIRYEYGIFDQEIRETATPGSWRAPSCASRSSSAGAPSSSSTSTAGRASTGSRTWWSMARPSTPRYSAMACRT